MLTNPFFILNYLLLILTEVNNVSCMKSSMTVDYSNFAKDVFNEEVKHVGQRSSAPTFGFFNLKTLNSVEIAKLISAFGI